MTILKLIPRILLSSAWLLAGAAQAYDNCDSLRQNDRAYQACVQNAYGGNSRTSPSTIPIYGPSEEEKETERKRLQREAEQREQRRLEQDPLYQARQREEAKARAEAEARRAKAAEMEAYRQWFERMDREEADKRYWAKEKADRTERLKRIRQRVNDRLEAEAQRIFAPGAASPTADDYDRLVTLSMPEWDLMRYWADQGLKQFPREFAFRHAVVQTIGCPGKRYAEDALTNAIKCPLPDFPDEAFLKMGEASPRLLDRAVACGLRYRKLERFGPTGSGGPYLEKSAAMMQPWLAEEAKLIQSARDCEKGLPPAIQANPALLKWMAGTRRDVLLDEPQTWHAYRRWLLASSASWRGLDLGNPAQVEQGWQRVEAAYRQGSEKEWTYFRD